MSGDLLSVRDLQVTFGGRGSAYENRREGDRIIQVDTANTRGWSTGP